MQAMQFFSGFPAKTRLVSLPDVVFTDLLPMVGSLDEARVILAVLRHLAMQDGEMRCVRLDDLLENPVLVGMGEGTICSALKLATQRGILLQVTVWYDGGDAEDLYFANSDKGREAVKAIEQGRWQPPGNGTAVAEAKRPNIFSLYEQLTGKSLSPLLADELREAEIEYPPDWIEEAFRQAARYNARSWAYVRKILEQRARRGRQSAHDGDVSAQWKAFLHGANRS